MYIKYKYVWVFIKNKNESLSFIVRLGLSFFRQGLNAGFAGELRNLILRNLKLKS